MHAHAYTALKNKHSKSADDTRYHGTLLGRPNDSGLVAVEGGGPASSIEEWIAQRHGLCTREEPPEDEDEDEDEDENENESVFSLLEDHDT